MRLPPCTISLSFLALLLSASSADAQSPIPVTPPKTQKAPKTAHSPARKSKPPLKKTQRSGKTPSKVVEQPADPSQKVVVPQGGTSEALPQIAPVAPQNQDSVERRKAGQL